MTEHAMPRRLALRAADAPRIISDEAQVGRFGGASVLLWAQVGPDGAGPANQIAAEVIRRWNAFDAVAATDAFAAGASTERSACAKLLQDYLDSCTGGTGAGCLHSDPQECSCVSVVEKLLSAIETRR